VHRPELQCISLAITWWISLAILDIISYNHHHPSSSASWISLEKVQKNQPSPPAAVSIEVLGLALRKWKTNSALLQVKTIQIMTLN